MSEEQIGEGVEKGQSQEETEETYLARADELADPIKKRSFEEMRLALAEAKAMLEEQKDDKRPTLRASQLQYIQDNITQWNRWLVQHVKNEAGAKIEQLAGEEGRKDRDWEEVWKIFIEPAENETQAEEIVEKALARAQEIAAAKRKEKGM